MIRIRVIDGNEFVIYRTRIDQFTSAFQSALAECRVIKVEARHTQPNTNRTVYINPVQVIYFEEVESGL